MYTSRTERPPSWFGAARQRAATAVEGSNSAVDRCRVRCALPVLLPEDHNEQLEAAFCSAAPAGRQQRSVGPRNRQRPDAAEPFSPASAAASTAPKWNNLLVQHARLTQARAPTEIRTPRAMPPRAWKGGRGRNLKCQVNKQKRPALPLLPYQIPPMAGARYRTSMTPSRRVDQRSRSTSFKDRCRRQGR